MVSNGPTANPIDAEFHISWHAMLSVCGSAWPPHSAGAASPFQPPLHQPRYASFQPGAVVTAPSLNGVPNVSPTRLSGAITSAAKRPASVSTASTSVHGEIAKQAFVDRRGKSGGIFESGADVGKRSAICHRRSP